MLNLYLNKMGMTKQNCSEEATIITRWNRLVKLISINHQNLSCNKIINMDCNFYDEGYNQILKIKFSRQHLIN